MEEQSCPKCGTDCYRDSADVGVGVIYGPWGCPGCAWSESSEYDRSDGRTPPAAIDWPGYYVSQFGRATPVAQLRARAAEFGINPAVIDDVFPAAKG